MINRVGLLSGVDRDPHQGRRSADVFSMRSSFLAAAVTLLATIQVAGQEARDSSKKERSNISAVVPDVQLRAWMKDLDSEEFDQRQKAWEDARSAAWSAFDTGSEEPTELLRRLQEADPTLSNEQRYRMRGLREALASWRTEIPRALPPLGEVRGGQAAHLVRRQTGVPLLIDDETATRLDAMTVQLPAERGDRHVTDVIATLCNAAGMVPQALPDGGVSLVPAAKDQRVVATDELLCVVTENREKGTRTVDVHFEPGRGAIIAFLNERGSYSAHGGCMEGMAAEGGEPEAGVMPIAIDETTDMTVPSSGRPDFRAVTGSGNINRTTKRPASKRFDAIVTDIPAKADIAPGEGAAMGFQRVTMRHPQQQENGEWTVVCHAMVCGDVPWPNTPYDWDMLTYHAADANRYVVRDGEGKEMPATVTDTEFNQRSMTVTISCPREPKSATVHAFTRIYARGFEAPVLGKVITPPARAPKDPGAR